MKILFLVLSFMTIASAQAKVSCDYFEDDNQMVHIKGQNEMNLYECLGYFHALDRLYLMDFFRRAAQGRNAEVLGYKAIKNDFFIRTLDFEIKAQKVFNDLDTTVKNILISYANGVNDVIKSKSWNFGGEFKTLGYEPEEWKPHHSILLIYLQSLNQTIKTFRQDLDESEWMLKYGERAASLFDEENTPWFTPVLKKNEYAEKTAIVNLGPKFKGRLDYDFSEAQGSNNWIFDKEKTASKKAMLANDPHLELKRPAFWYWVHLDYGSINVVGSTIPGLPFVVAGTTPHLSWGLTNSYYDTADAVLLDEKEVQDLPSIRPNVKFKFGPLTLPFVFKTYQLAKGKYPVLPLPAPKGKVIALRWSGLDITAQDIMSYKDIVYAKNVTEAQKVLRGMGAPSWNFVFADHEGNIGYQVVGRLPKRTTKTFGALPLALKDMDFEYLKPEENPNLLKPARHFVVTANQRHYSGSSKYVGGQGNAFSLRANRIESLLMEKSQKKKLTVADFQSVQCDTSAHDANYFLPLILKELDAKKVWQNKEKEAFAILKNWDFQTLANCEACTIYRRTMELLKEENKVNEIALYQLMAKNEVTISNSFARAVKELWNKDKVRFVNWEEYHRLYFEHISGKDELNNQESIFTQGDQHSVNPGTARYVDDVLWHHNGASQRVVVEMTNPPQVFLSFPGNNRGNYFAIQGDSWNGWRECQFRNVLYPLDWSKVTLSHTN